MSYDLYFVPMIAKALQQAYPATALQRALAEVAERGRQPAYARGYANFQQFIVEVQRHALSEQLVDLDVNSIRELITELATDTFDGNTGERQAALDVIFSKPALRAEYENLCTTVGAGVAVAGTASLTLRKGAELFARIELDRNSPRKSVPAVVSGDYSLAMENGRVIWEGRLTSRHLIWSAAFPGRALDLAADTGEGPSTTTLDEWLLDGALTLRVTPGLESGRMAIEIHQLPEDR